MPNGKRPYTKEQRNNIAAQKADAEFKKNRAGIKGESIMDYVRAWKDSDLNDKRKETKKAAEDGPKGVKSSQITSKDLKGNDDRDWSSIAHKDGVYTIQVTPGKWITKSK